MGLLLVVLNASVGDPGLDLFPDPVGWGLVLVGLARLPARIPHRPATTAVAWVALLVSAVLWVPDLARRLQPVDESFLWLLDLPTPVFVLLLARALGSAAGAGEDHRARTWWQVVMVGTAITILLPPVVYGAGLVALAVVAVAVAIGTLVACLVLCFAHSARPWVHDPLPTAGRAPG